MPYGVEVFNESGESSILTPNVKNIISSGTVTLQSVLRSDGTFGVNIALPGTTPYSEDSIGVLVTPRNYSLSYQTAWIDWGLSPKQWSLCKWLYYNTAFFTRNDATGVMTSFAEEQYKDTYYNFHPVAFWDKLGQTTFNVVRLFAGVVFYIYDNSASAYKEVWHLGLISQVDYVVYLRNV
jgi:hypothetical protein